MRYYLCPLACKSWEECNTAIYILHEQEKIFTYDLQRIREVKASIFTPPALSTGIWEEPPHHMQSSIRDLLLNAKRDRHTANDRVDIFPLELCLYFHLSSA